MNIRTIANGWASAAKQLRDCDLEPKNPNRVSTNEAQAQVFAACASVLLGKFGEQATGATIPAVLYAEQKLLSGEVVGLALVRTRWNNEGQAVFERTDAHGAIDMVEHFPWYVRSKDDGPATLVLDDASKALLEESEVVNALMDELVDLGAAWGIEGKLPL